MELFKAHNQWATRPEDERFWGLDDAKEAMLALRQRTAVLPAKLDDIRVETDKDDILLVGKRGMPATFSHFAFGQMCTRIKAPASYLRSLPPTLVAQNVNHGLKETYNNSGDEARSLFLKPENEGDRPVLRAMSSEAYQHFWNFEIFEKLQGLETRGWRVPPARPADGTTKTRIATEKDVLDLKAGGFLSVCVGDEIAPAGVYASDHDMFVFMVNEDNKIDAGSGKMLSKGFFLWNGEVPGISFGMTMFLYNHVCGNHIVWGAQDVTEIRFTHVGADKKNRAFDDIRGLAFKAAQEKGSVYEEKIKAAQTLEFGPGKKETIDVISQVVNRRKIGISARTLDAAYDRAEQKEDLYGPPTTLWGMINGLTEISQDKGYTDDRTSMDRAAGKLLEYF